MPRRNKREQYTPLDLTVEVLKPVEAPKGRLSRADAEHAARLRQVEREAERVRKQEQALAQGGIDWSLCMVPGCGKDLRTYGRVRHSAADRDTGRHLPLCFEHGIVAWRQIQRASDLPVIIETAAEVEQREQAHKETISPRPTVERDGLMYFVRINDLVKVGWTSDFYRRLKEYGAGAEVLCHYPATRDEETALHRQLRPSLAKGREWYHDGDVIRLFVKNALERHGPPTITVADWTVPRKDVIKLRSRR